MTSLSTYLLPALLALALTFTPAWAQGAPSAPGEIRGIVVAEGSGTPLAGAVVAVRGAPDSAQVGSASTDEGGRFRVTGVPVGSWAVQVTLPGYAPVARTGVAVARAAPVADLGLIALEPSVFALEGIEVEVERSAVEIAPDRTAYSTRDMPVASGGTATDVLRSVPELEVDVDGAVSLRGTAARIYLNGRPAPMEGEALQQFLQQFPAERIERVEVIANPSARFEAEGGGGIVNVVLKENVDLGLSGSLFANGSTRGDVGGGGRLAYQRGPLTLFGGTFLRLSRRSETSYDLRRNLLADPVTELVQDARSERDGLSGSVDLTAELRVSERSTLWSEVGFYGSGSDAEGVAAYTLSAAAGDPADRYDRLTERESERLDTDLSVGFRHELAPRSHELTAELRFEDGTDDDLELARRLQLAPDGGDIGLPEELVRDATYGDERELTAELDYVRPWGERGQLQAGYRGEREEEDDDRRVETFAGAPGSAPVAARSTGYTHRETSHAAYLIATRRFGRLGVQAGARAELARSRFGLPGTGEVFEKEYGSLFPSANLTYELGGGKQARLSYTRRIRRPSPRVLDPTDRSSDPLNRRVGNPDIEPQYTQSLSLETSWAGQAGSLRFSPYYRRTENEWTQIRTVSAAGVSTLTWESLASTDAYGASLTASLRPTGGWSGYASVSGHREVRDASNLSVDYSGAAFRWSARGNLSARLGGSLSAQGMFFYTPPRDVPQGRIGSRLMTHFGVRQQLRDGRASLSLMVTDPFDLARSSFETRDPTHVQVGRSSWRARSAVLSLSYAFGRPPRDARDRERESPDEEEPESVIR
ncbi:MAG TPA: TonB-dependent receptor [Longimicrobiaceae bacterium]|nr:TonB-dependent receptor [Longimicrobiaceae bacterium]